MSRRARLRLQRYPSTNNTISTVITAPTAMPTMPSVLSMELDASDTLDELAPEVGAAVVGEVVGAAVVGAAVVVVGAWVGGATVGCAVGRLVGRDVGAGVVLGAAVGADVGGGPGSAAEELHTVKANGTNTAASAMATRTTHDRMRLGVSRSVTAIAASSNCSVTQDPRAYTYTYPSAHILQYTRGMKRAFISQRSGRLVRVKQVRIDGCNHMGPAGWAAAAARAELARASDARKSMAEVSIAPSYLDPMIIIGV